MNATAKKEVVKRLLAHAQSRVGRTSFVDQASYLSDSTVNPSDNAEAIGQDLLKKGGLQNTFSVRYAEVKIAELLYYVRSKHTITEEAIAIALQPIIDEMESYSQRQEVYVPLVGISMYTNTLDLGNIDLVNMASGEYNRLVERITAILATTLPEEGRKGAIESEQNVLSTQIKDRVCARYIVLAESERAIELAETEIQQAVDLLRFAASFLYSYRSKIKIGLAGEINQVGIQGIVVIATDDQTSHIQEKVVGTPLNFDLTDENIQQMRNIGVFDVAELLKNPKRNSFANTLLAGIHMFANAQNEVRLEYKLLNLITCLEIFFTQQNGNPIRATIADGVAFVVGSSREERKYVKDKINKFYQKRSSLSHGGSVDITAQEIQELYTIVGKLLVNLIHKSSLDEGSFSDKNQLCEWIEDQKFS